MQKKENEKELEMAQKNSSTFKKLMQSKEFIEDILNTNDGKEIIDKFEAQGIDINKIQFSELCNILVQRLKSDDSNPNLEVSSIDSPISVDYEKRIDKTIVLKNLISLRRRRKSLPFLAMPPLHKWFNL